MGLQAEVCHDLECIGVDAWFEEGNVLCADEHDFIYNRLGFFEAANNCLINKEWGMISCTGTAKFVLCDIGQEIDENDY